MGEEAVELDGPEYDEPDNSAVESEETEVADPVETDEPGGEEEAQPEAKKPPPLTEEQQAAVNDAIGKKVAKQREAERQAQEYQQQLQELSQRLQKYETPVRPDIPPPPDPYEDGFAQKVAERDAIIARAAQFDAQIEWEKQQEQRKQQEAANAERERVGKVVQSYSDTAGKMGITADELQAAGAQIAPMVPDRLALRILNDPQGPEITTYLAKNLVELDTLSRMHPEDAAVYLETAIKPKAKRPPPKLAPDPSDKLSGASMREGDMGPKGATYE
jgi:DNA repair exonuclease SbcCD ATPase subunit